MRISIFVFTLLAFPTFCFSAVIHVPGDQPTIQSGINAAQDRDIVLVAPGTYYEQIRFNGKNITLESSGGPERTIIDGSGYGPVVRFEEKEGRMAILRGFTITNGKESLRGGGIRCDESSPQIIGNIITQNDARYGSGIYCILADPIIRNNHIHENGSSALYGFGGGIYCDRSSAVVENNTIEWNRAGMFSQNCGGGVFCKLSSNPIIANNDIEKNYGGGICCKTCDPVIRNNYLKRNLSEQYSGIYIQTTPHALIESNTLYKNGDNGIGCDSATFTITNNIISGHFEWGIDTFNSRGKISDNAILDNLYSGIRCRSNRHGLCIERNTIRGNSGGVELFSGINPIVTRNTIVDNHAQHGGGIYCLNSESPEITNNFICRNSATELGGGVRLHISVGVVTIENNTFFGNSATQGGGIYSSGVEKPMIENSIFRENEPAQIHGNIEASFCNIQGGFPGTGNMDVDPQFIDVANDDYHLLHASPCRDAGNNSLVSDAFDVELDPRIVDGVVDIGADEYHPHLYFLCSEVAPGAEATIKLVSAPNASPAILFIGNGILEPPQPTAWGEFYLKEPWYMVNLWPVPSNGLISFKTNLPSIVAPFHIPLQALVGSGLTNLCNIEVYRTH